MAGNDRKGEALRLDRLSVRRGGREVLHDISLDLREGDFLALIGANGSGKTTLLRTILGFLQHFSGGVTFYGTPVREFGALRKKVGFVPQTHDVDFRMPLSVEEVVSIGRFGIAGAGKKLSRRDREAVRDSIADAGIQHLAERPIGHLSGGELQKVQIARALCQGPRMLLLDEPTSNLDMGAQRELLDLIGNLHRSHGLTSLIVMHDLKSLPAVCNRAVVIESGRKVFDGEFQDAFTEENLRHIYGRQPDHVLRELTADLRSGRSGT